MIEPAPGNGSQESTELLRPSISHWISFLSYSSAIVICILWLKRRRKSGRAEQNRTQKWWSVRGHITNITNKSMSVTSVWKRMDNLVNSSVVSPQRDVFLALTSPQLSLSDCPAKRCSEWVICMLRVYSVLFVRVTNTNCLFSILYMTRHTERSE